MKLNFDFLLKNLDGADIENAHAGKSLANSLVSVAKGDAFKHYEWSKNLYAGKIIDLDKSDQKYLQDFITNSDTMTILAKAQMLEVFEKREKKESSNGQQEKEVEATKSE